MLQEADKAHEDEGFRDSKKRQLILKMQSMLRFKAIFLAHIYEWQAYDYNAVASWLVCSTPERMVRVQFLAGNIVLCSYASHFTLTVPLSTQVYKWVPQI